MSRSVQSSSSRIFVSEESSCPWACHGPPGSHGWELALARLIPDWNWAADHCPNSLPPADLKRLIGIRPSMISAKSRQEMVLAQLERELLVESWLTNKEVRQRISAFRKLPSIPSIYNQVIAELESPSGSFDKVAKLIAQDPVMTAKILQVVNSALFALSSAVTKPEEAVLILGAERTKALVLAVPVFTRLDSRACPGLSPDGIWQHSMEVATFARLVVLSEKCSVSDADAAFTPLTAVHVANALFYERRRSKECALDQVYIRRIGLLDHRNKWRTACGIAPRDKAMIRRDARSN
jgi:hypothetical protein